MVHSCSPDLLSLLSTQRRGFFRGRKVGNSRQPLRNSQCLSEHSFKGAEGERKKTVAEKDQKKKRRNQRHLQSWTTARQSVFLFRKAGMETCRDEFCIFRKVNSRLSLGFLQNYRNQRWKRPINSSFHFPPGQSRIAPRRRLFLARC